jgi:DNA polymerase-3 subunit delta
VKANRAQIERALRNPAPEWRLFLLHGPDDAGSRGLARLLAEALGGEAERIDLSGALLKADPARLADEAAAISLFGGARYIVVEADGDEVVPAVTALIEARTAGNPVVIVAGALRATSKLLKLALSEASALAFASYVPEGRDADRLVIDLAAQFGLAVRADAARRVAEATGGNRALIEGELAKFALYLDAAPDRPRPLDHAAIDAVGADSGEGDLSRLADAVAQGEPALVDAELNRLAGEGVEGVPLVRALLRRMLLLARLRAEVDRGKSVDAVMASQGKALFWKEKPAIAEQLGRWRSDVLAKAIARLLEAERQVKAPGGLGPVAVDEELLTISRQAARLR